MREAALPLRDLAQTAVVAVSQRYAAHLDDVLGGVGRGCIGLGESPVASQE